MISDFLSFLKQSSDGCFEAQVAQVRPSRSPFGMAPVPLWCVVLKLSDHLLPYRTRRSRFILYFRYPAPGSFSVRIMYFAPKNLNSAV